MSDPAARAAQRVVASMKAAYTRQETWLPVDHDEFKHLDLAAYDAFQADMEAHGFRHVGDYEVAEVTNSPGTVIARTFVRAMISREGNIAAEYYQVKPRVARRVSNLLIGLLNLRLIDAPQNFREGMKTRHCVGFDTEFADGRFIGTSNAEAAGMITSPPEIDALFFPYGTPVDEVLDTHYKRLVRELKGGATPLVLKTLDDIRQSANRAKALKNAFRASTGWVSRAELNKLSGGNASQANDVFAEVVKQRGAAGGAPSPAARPAAPVRDRAEAEAAALEEEEELEDEAPEDEEREGSGKRGCLFFPLLIVGLVLMMVLPRRAGAWLASKGMRFMLPPQVRAKMEASERQMAEAQARPMPRRVAAAGAQPGAGAGRIARPPGAAAAPAGSLAFAYDPERGELVAAVELAAWAGYACENSNPEFPGGRALLRLRGVDDVELDEADPAHHTAVAWLRANDQAVHDAILAALARYARTLRARLEEYGDDDSVRLLKSASGWNKLIDLSYVDVFPYSRDGMPYFEFEFECNWDPEHGFKLLVNGTRVVDIDGDGYGSEDVEADGGIAA